MKRDSCTQESLTRISHKRKKNKKGGKRQKKKNEKGKGPRGSQRQYNSLPYSKEHDCQRRGEEYTGALGAYRRMKHKRITFHFA